MAYEPVFNAAVAAAKAKELEVLENDKNAGRLVLERRHALEWGERLGALFTLHSA